MILKRNKYIVIQALNALSITNIVKTDNMIRHDGHYVAKMNPHKGSNSPEVFCLKCHEVFRVPSGVLFRV